jgi:hypothetical protein
MLKHLTHDAILYRNPTAHNSSTSNCPT